MTDEELLRTLESRVFYTMFNGCFIETHLGNPKHDTGSWAVTLRADELSRLIDMAKEGVKHD
jgi:hypothetical protein